MLLQLKLTPEYSGAGAQVLSHRRVSVTPFMTSQMTSVGLAVAKGTAAEDAAEWRATVVNCTAMQEQGRGSGKGFEAFRARERAFSRVASLMD